jgi:DNA-directed RNA polymerase specialized sigma24 family protein
MHGTLIQGGTDGLHADPVTVDDVGRLYDQHSRAVYALAFGLLRDRVAAEDATAATFLVAGREIQAIPGHPHPERGWFLATARREARARQQGQANGFPTLPADERRALALAVGPGLTTPEIAVQMGVPAEKVKRLMWYGLRRVQAIVGEA